MSEEKQVNENFGLDGAQKQDDTADRDRKFLRSLRQSRTGYMMNIKRESKKGYALLAEPTPDRAVLVVRARKLRQYAMEVRRLDSEILLFVDPSDEEAEIDRRSAELNDIWEDIHTFETHLDHFEDEQKRQFARTSRPYEAQAGQILGAGSHNTSDLSTSTATHSHVKLPKLQMPKYSGDPLQFQEFWDFFESTIHNHPTLSDAEKFTYLKGQLRDKALSHVAGYKPTTANYAHVVETFKERFGNPAMAQIAHFEALLSIPMSTTDTEQLRSMYDNCEMHIRSLVALGLSENTFEVVFCPILLWKLPWAVRSELVRKNGAKVWTLPNLRQLLKEELVVREMCHAVVYTDNRNQRPTSDRNKGAAPHRSSNRGTASSLVSTNNPRSDNAQKVPVCAFCNQRHYSDQCERFPTVESRKRQLHKEACFTCLSIGKHAPYCRAYRCHHCKQPGHHRSLCEARFDTRVAKASANVAAASALNPVAQPFCPSSQPDVSMIASGQRAILQTARAEIRSTAGSKGLMARLLLDTGSSRTYITTAVPGRLGLTSTSVDVIAVAGFGDKQRKSMQYPVVEFAVVDRDCQLIKITANVTPHITCPIERFPLDSNVLPMLLKLGLADDIPEQNETVDIDILIGCDYYHDIVLGGRMQADGGLVLLDSRLGTVISGRVEDTSPQKTGTALLIAHKQADNYDLEKFWRLESIGIQDKVVKEDEEVLRQFEKSIKVHRGRYSVNWPWKNNVDQLPDNYQLALGRLRSLMRKLKTDDNLLLLYNKTITEQLAAGVIEVAPEVPEGREHYIPHHAVVTPGKTTTKLRVVYDASAKTRVSSVSLNECLHRGPVLLSDLVGLMLRFRTFRFGMVSDVEKAFLQIGLEPEDRDVTRFLWLRHPCKPISDDNLVIYRFCRIPFGLKPCSFFLEGVMSRHLKLTGTPVALQIDDDHYADNIATGADSQLKCLEFYSEAKQIFRSASMNLREWYSNCPELMDRIPDSDKGGSEETKVLGLIWNTANDTLRCSDLLISNSNSITKRRCLKVIASVFDPCGFLSPITIKGKMLMQSLWKSGCGWDEPIPDDTREEWRTVEQSLRSVGTFVLPRWIVSSDCCSSRRLEIHCFCDASVVAYGAALYLLCKSQGATSAYLLMSKTRVSPLKPQHTTPNLELMAMVIGARIVRFAITEIKIPISKVVMWSDSQCSLCWVRLNRVKTPFVRNRVNEILSSETSEYRYVRSEDNPADLLSRGVDAEQLRTSILWWSGPGWLTKPDEWPTWEPPTADKLSIEQDATVVYENEALVETQAAIPELLFDPSRCCSLDKLLRITCWIIRFVKAVRKDKQSGHLNADEIENAKLLWERQVQSMGMAKSSLGRRGLYSNLNPFVDSKGIVRCKGRLKLAGLAENATYPKLLPRDSQFSNLVIKHVHEQVGHAGVDHTLSQLRYEYWIPKGRNQVKRVLSQCRICRRVCGGPFRPPVRPDLPDFRVAQAQPFTYTGLDYMGPLHIRDSPGQGAPTKVWICLFTCASTRAVHLEVVESMSTACFLLCLRRFVSVRGCPRMLISDNATQFHAAEKELQRLWLGFREDGDVAGYLAKNRMTWKFIPEFAPWFGGFFERLVGIAKIALRKSLDSRCVGLVELQTVVAEAARVVNSRPLVYVGDEVGEQCLTPSHFLNGCQSILPEGPTEDDRDPEFQPKGLKQSELILGWRRSQAALNAFWKLWVGRYLLSLRSRHQKLAERGSSDIAPELGTIVLIKRANAPRASWQLGRIVKKHVSRDGLCRSVKVRCPNGRELVRPVKLLFPLEAADTTAAPAEKEKIRTEEGREQRTRRKAAVDSIRKVRQCLAASDSE